MDARPNFADEVDKQLSMGFSAGEIKANMTNKGYSAHEVEAYLYLKANEPKLRGKPNYLQLLVSALIITIGMMDVINNKTGFRHTWGYVLIVIGGLGLLLKLFRRSS